MIIMPAAPAALVAKIGVVPNIVRQQNPFNGRVRQFDRMGSKHAITIEPARLDFDETALQWIGKLADAAGTGDMIRVGIPQLRPAELDSIPTALVMGASQSGRTLNIDGITASDRGNKLANSTDLSNASFWDVAAVTVAPRADSNSWSVLANTSSAQHYIASNTGANPVSLSSGVAYMAEADLAHLGHDWCVVAIGGTGNLFRACVNLLTGDVGLTSATSGTHTVTMRRLASGRWRFRMAFTAAATNTAAFSFGINNTNSLTISTFTGTGATGVIVGRPHVHTGSAAQRYSPTVTALSIHHIDTGRAFHIADAAGNRYAYIVGDGGGPVNASGQAALPLNTMLRATYADNAPLTFNQPSLDGFLEGPGMWELTKNKYLSAPISITEAR